MKINTFQRHRYLGLTLLECLIALAMASILGSISIASYQSITMKTRVHTSLIELQQTLKLARSQAIHDKQTVTVCQTRDHQNCSRNYKSDWRYGWIAFLDTNSNGLRDQSDKIIDSYDGIHKNDKLNWHVFGRPAILQYQPNGFLNMGAAKNASFRYCPALNTQKYAKALIINRLGRVRFSQDYNNDGQDDISPNQTLACV